VAKAVRDDDQAFGWQKHFRDMPTNSQLDGKRYAANRRNSMATFG
jgi:hypothetical protein